MHIPSATRERMCTIMAETLEGMVAGDDALTLLERARSKLLLLPPPADFSLRTELATRLRLWRDGGFLELLVRAEEQVRARAASRKRQRATGGRSTRRPRAPRAHPRA